MNPMLNFDPEFDEPAYAYLWQDDEEADELEDDDHPSLTVAERNPSLR